MAEINYKHLRYFWAVAHDGNLTRTAERLGVSQSALSIQIRKLEERLGHALFDRKRRTLHLTEAGRIALDHADAIFAAGDELVQTLRDAEASRRTLRVGALSTLSRNFQIIFLEPVIGREDVEIVLRSGGAAELLAELEALNLDVVLTNRPPTGEGPASFGAHRIAEQSASLVGVPDLVPPSASLEHLLVRSPLILPSQESGLRAGFDGLADRLQVRPRIAAEVDDMAMIRLLAREGEGLAVVPPIVVRDELTSGRLVEAVHELGIVETFYAVTVPRRFPNPVLRELLTERT